MTEPSEKEIIDFIEYCEKLKLLQEHKKPDAKHVLEIRSQVPVHAKKQDLLRYVAERWGISPQLIEQALQVSHPSNELLEKLYADYGVKPGPGYFVKLRYAEKQKVVDHFIAYLQSVLNDHFSGAYRVRASESGISVDKLDLFEDRTITRKKGWFRTKEVEELIKRPLETLVCLISFKLRKDEDFLESFFPGSMKVLFTNNDPRSMVVLLPALKSLHDHYKAQFPDELEIERNY